MNIKTVEVRRLFSFGNYENITIGYTAEVEAGEDPSNVRDILTRKIEIEYAERAHEALQTQNAQAEASYLVHSKLPDLRHEAVELERKIDKMLAFLKSHGVDTMTYELPF